MSVKLKHCCQTNGNNKSDEEKHRKRIQSIQLAYHIVPEFNFQASLHAFLNLEAAVCLPYFSVTAFRRKSLRYKLLRNVVLNTALILTGL
jgi:hypothetical protein